MVEKLPNRESLGRRILKIAPAGLVLFYLGFGPVKEASAGFKDEVQEMITQLPKRGKSETLSHYLPGVGSDFSLLLKEHPSLRKTIELYSEEERRKLLDSLEQFVNANFHVGYPTIRQGGDMNVYPDTRILAESIKELIVKQLKGKLVGDREDAEFVVSEITIKGEKFSGERHKIIPGFLEVRNVEPAIIIQFSIRDERQKLKPGEVVTLKGYARIPIRELSRKGRGDFNQNELNEGTEKAMRNIGFFIQTLYRQRQFIEATKHLRNPVFPIEGALLIDEKFKKIYYPVFLDKSLGQYFKPGDKVRIVDSETGEIIEEFEIPDCIYYTSEKEIIVFIQSPNLKPGDKNLEKKRGGLYIEKVESPK